MDDEIDIEEHDILEHPQVKAIFPDLSKIHIEVHGEDEFLEYPAHSEENHSLLEEREDYDGNEVEEKPQDEEEGREYEEEYLEDNKEDLEKFKKINDHYKKRDQQTELDIEIDKDIVNGSENIIDEVHEISDDEAENDDADNELNELTAEPQSKSSDIVKKQSVQELVQNVQEISDDEENIDIAEVIREIKKKHEEVEQKNCEPITPQSGEENKENGDVLIKDREIDDEIQEAPDNIDVLSGEAQQNNENLTQDTEFTNESNDKDIPEQNGHQENLENSEESKIYIEVPIKQEIEEVSIKTEIIDEEDNFEDDLFNQPLEVYNNKIILGSKPSPLVKSNLYRDTRRNTYLVVALEDWGTHLKESNSYCNQCQILFTTPNALDAHRMVAHSLLAPITNRAVKSTAKSSKAVVKNIAKKSTGTVEISGSTYCNHCNITFKDHTALIKHLYELLPVKNYTCNFCNETFVNHSDLLTHNAIHIKIEPRKILKVKKNLENNPILTKLLTSKGKSIFSVKQNEQKEIKSILPAEEVKKKLGAKQNKQKTVKRSYPVEVKVENEDNVQCNFECTVCEDVLESYGAARKHRLNHPERKGFNIFKKVFTKENPSNIKEKIQFEDDTHVSKKAKKSESNDTGIHVKLKSMKNSNKDFDLIPKDALFQCSTCSIHFASSIAGNSHLSGNKCSSGDTQHWSCPTCKKKLRRIDKNCHTKQHELTSKIRIYKITRNTNERTLCRCLKCGVYFEYILLKMHINKCGKIPTAKCQRCNIVIAKNKIAEHTLKHDSAKLKPKDFILVDYVVVNDKTKKPVAKKAKKPVKKPAANESKVKIDQSIVKTEPGTQKQSKIISKLKYEKDKTPLFYCKFCKLCLFSKNHIASKRTHLTKSCLGMYRNNAYYCKWCGLLIHKKSRRKHEALHTVKGLSLKDFEFFEYATHKPVIPPIPKYPSCDKCGIHFLVRKMTKNNHICGEDYENCEFCGEKFEMSALKLHRMFHRLQKPVQREPSPVKILPELMMMYESLNAIWNILFICGKCELVTDSYNTAVEHSQAHLKKDRSQPNTVKCYICNFKIDNNCWSKHRELHGRMNIQRKDFKLLKYSPENLLDESWFQMFESLPEKEIRQIIDRSVFGSERSLKMRLIKHGLPEFTVYCCSNCKVSYDNNDILEHVAAKCVSSTHICHKCAITFNSANSLEFHQLLHKKGIKKDEFRIVHFVKDKNIEMHVPVKTKPTIKKIVEIKSRRVGERNKNVQFVLYKCKVCTVCIQKKNNIKRHNCAPEHHLHYCNTCKLNFTFRRKSNHLKLHKTEPRLRAKNIKTISFTPRESEDENFTSRPISESKDENLKVADETIAKSTAVVSEFFTKTTEKDVESSYEDLNSSTLKPGNKRSSVESFESLVNILTNDKPKPKRNTLNSSRSIIKHTDTPEKKSAKVYKCDCGLHYTSLKSIEKHIEKCDNSKEISSENCSKCGLLFPTDILVSHLCKHHSHDSVITVQNIHKSETKAASLPKPKATTKLYKCSDCNVYYLNQNTCYKHTYRHAPLDPRQFIECKICSLQFTIPCLRSHIRRHHEKEFDLEKVLVEEYHPSIGKAAPKIDIYYASERVQNVQVSSSND